MNLVPFGEFVPWPFSTFVDKVSTEAGVFTPGDKVVVAPLAGLKLGAFICYESAFPHHVRQFTAQGAEVLLNLSNDGYFARSAAREQHYALTRMRAIENDRWLLRSTNDGLTASVAPTGAGDAFRAEMYREATIWLPYERRATLTPYVRYGDWFAWTCLIASLASIAWDARRRRAAQA